MKKYYALLATTGFLLWIAETAFFGFNQEPVNIYEQILDYATTIMLFWGVIGDLLSNIQIVKTETNNINTKNVLINGKPIINFDSKK